MLVEKFDPKLANYAYINLYSPKNASTKTKHRKQT